MGSGAGLGTAMIKLLLLIFNLAFFLFNLIMAVVFGWKVASKTGMSGIIFWIQLSLVGLTLTFLFGIFITLKRRFLLLKVYTMFLGLFVICQIGGVGLFFVKPTLLDKYAGPVHDSMCQAFLDAEKDVAHVGSRVSGLEGKVPWFCCCPSEAVCSGEKPWPNVVSPPPSPPPSPSPPAPAGKTPTIPENCIPPNGVGCPTWLVQMNGTDFCACGEKTHQRSAFTASCTCHCDPSDDICRRGCVTSAAASMPSCSDSGRRRLQLQPLQPHRSKMTLTLPRQLQSAAVSPNVSLCSNTPAQALYENTKYYPTDGKCKSWNKCAAEWIKDHMETFIVVIGVVVFLEMCMTVATFKLSQSMNTKGDTWYSPSGDLDETASGADQLNQYLGDFK